LRLIESVEDTPSPQELFPLTIIMFPETEDAS
jgi:hypothetical protein